MRPIANKTMYLSLFLTAMLIAGCVEKTSTKKSKEECVQQIIQTDKDFNDMAQAEGIGKAFVHFADSEIIKFSDGYYPVVGIVDLDSSFIKAADFFKDFKLIWEPLKADVSSDGEMGYSIGTSTYTYKKGDKDTSGFGIYITVWKLQPDGTYKYVMDAGNNVPGVLTKEMLQVAR